MHVLSHVPNLAGKLACTCSLIFEELEPAISRRPSQKMSGLEIESMTTEEVGEWLKKKGLSEDVVDAFAGECSIIYQLCHAMPGG